MARINSVKKCRKAQGNCYTCGQEITVGSAYMWSKANRFAPKYKWHTTCDRPKPSVLESNYKRGMLMEAQEDAEAATGSLEHPESLEDCDAFVEELTAIRDNAAQAVRDVAQEYSDSADNMESGFGHETEGSMQQREYADQIESSADEIESVEFDEAPEDADELETWASDQVEKLEDAISQIEIP